MDLQTIAEKLNEVNSVLIFCHSRPDGDTLGSAFAIKRYFEKLSKTADIICDSPIPEKFSFMPISKSVKTLDDIDRTYDAHLAIDCSTEGMLGDNYRLFIKNNKTFNIDHHVSNTKYAKYNYVDDRAACCEIVYELLKVMGCDIDRDIANSILLGISTDTGHFMHNNVTASTLMIASELVKAGGDLHEIGYKMFKSQPKNRAELQAAILSKIKFYSDDKISMITIMQSDLDRFNATSDLTEGFIDYPLSVNGVEVAVSILESKSNCYKISFRSKGRVNVNEIAATFGGGGHIMASGCMLHGFYEDVKEKLIRTISQYL